MTHQILEPTFERNDDRGLFREVLNDGTWEALICGRMKPLSVIGNHYHKDTLVFLYLTSGSAHIRTVHVVTGQRDEFSLNSGHGVVLRTDEAHAITFQEESDFVMLKSHRFDPAALDTFNFPV
ncbi:MAG: hypothetical protein WCG29_01185 [Desulfomonile sp.]|jgi:hypothetical protein|nr:hypothetical protein [Deltaproteobacteria bacterium]